MNRIEEMLRREVSSILSVDRDSIATEAPLRELGMNSIGFVELLLAIERELEIKLIDTDLSRENLHSIKALAEHLASTIGK